MKRLVKPLIILAAIGIGGFLFMRSVQSTRTAPYTIRAAHLAQWTIALNTAAALSDAMLVARPAREVASDLFRQLFTRAAESMNGPSLPSVPLLLREEFERAFAGQATPESLMQAAQDAGIGKGWTPRCMGHKRDSAPGVTRQLYFVLFDAPSFASFRQQLASLRIPDSVYDPAVLSPVMFVAASDAEFHRWLPLRANAETDCVAPISVESGG